MPAIEAAADAPIMGSSQVTVLTRWASVTVETPFESLIVALLGRSVSIHNGH
jgi:hypothetical protein